MPETRFTKMTRRIRARLWDYNLDILLPLRTGLKRCATRCDICPNPTSPTAWIFLRPAHSGRSRWGIPLLKSNRRWARPLHAGKSHLKLSKTTLSLTTTRNSFRLEEYVPKYEQFDEVLGECPCDLNALFVSRDRAAHRPCT